jgi:hypothetical protein
MMFLSMFSLMPSRVLAVMKFKASVYNMVLFM